MAENDRLTALHVRVAGNDCVDVLLGKIYESRLKLNGGVEGATASELRPETSVGSDLVVT